MSTASPVTRRVDGRALGALRTPHIEIGFHRPSEGSVLYRAGGTVVLCTASVDPKVPAFLEGTGKGWITAEYQMHPRANPKREGREGRGTKQVSGRTHEIQRLIGRALRAAVDLGKLGERQIAVDCDVLEADGGTRTAAITGGFIALALALGKLRAQGLLAEPVLRSPVAATSVGLVDLVGALGETTEHVMLDLAYVEDSKARVDLNLVANERREMIEVQGTAEGEPIARTRLDALIDLALEGVATLCAVQRAALSGAGVELAALTIPVGSEAAGAAEPA
jgi:ribonuclease PH